jgi:hypothetical protein
MKLGEQKGKPRERDMAARFIHMKADFSSFLVALIIKGSKLGSDLYNNQASLNVY